MAFTGVRIKYDGGKVRLLGVGFQKYQMLRLGSLALKDLKRRVQEGKGVNDEPMPPLKVQQVRPGSVTASLERGYPRLKRRRGRKPIRDLTLTGAMLANLTIRSASPNEVKFGLTKQKEREKALANERRYPWLGWSPSNVNTVMKEAEKMFKVQVAAFANQLRGVSLLNPRGFFRRAA